MNDPKVTSHHGTQPAVEGLRAERRPKESEVKIFGRLCELLHPSLLSTAIWLSVKKSQANVLLLGAQQCAMQT